MAGNPDGPGLTYGYLLAQNAPNPCILTTQIRFEIPRRTHVSMAIYNALGQRVRVLIDGSIEPGEHSVVAYVVSERAPGEVTGNILNGSAGSGLVVGAVPEPAVLSLLALGGGLLLRRRRRR